MRNILILVALCCQVSSTLFGQTPESVIDKYLIASGGRDKLAAISSTYQRLYNFRPGGDTSVVEQTEALPHFTFRTHGRKAKNLLEMYQYKNGNGSYLYTKKLRYLRPERHQPAVTRPTFCIPQNVYEMFTRGELVYLHEQNLRGKSYYSFEVPTIRNTIPAKNVYYFGKKSGLLEVSRASNDSTILTYYQNYKDVDGIVIPFTTITTENDTITFTSQITTFDVNVEIDTTIFYPPHLTSFRHQENRFQKVEFLKPEFGERTLEELLGYFAGKRILIDLWASWCVPCNAEFSLYDDKFYEFLFFNRIEMLFISIDSPGKESKWKEMIDWFNVNGYHLRAGEKLTQSLGSEIFKDEPLGKKGQFAIPRYILVDEHGQILDDNIPKPSSPDFTHAIRQALTKN